MVVIEVLKRSDTIGRRTETQRDDGRLLESAEGYSKPDERAVWRKKLEAALGTEG
jgi:hypothetical protein